MDHFVLQKIAEERAACAQTCRNVAIGMGDGDKTSVAEICAVAIEARSTCLHIQEKQKQDAFEDMETRVIERTAEAVENLRRIFEERKKRKS
jgi:hypothetical protein